MANIQIEIVSVGKVESVPTKGGKSYQVVEVAYKKDGKIEGKKIMSFVNPSVFKEVQNFKAGDNVSVEIEKDEKGYWQWRGFVSTAVQEPTPTQPAAKTVSNYETREERQQRQQFIIRQSSLASAISFYAETEEVPTVEKILSVAEQFVNYVNDGLPKTAIQELEDMPNDIPY